MFLDFLVRHVYPKMAKSHNASNEMRQVSAELYMYATMSQYCFY